MYDLLRAASCDIPHERVGTVYHGHWVLRLVVIHILTSPTKLRLIGICVISYHTRDKGYDLPMALGFACGDMTYDTRGTICYGLWVLPLVRGYLSHETGGTVCYGHWVLILVISYTRQHWVLR